MMMTMTASMSMKCCTAQYHRTAALHVLRCSPSSSKPAEAPCRHRRAWPQRYFSQRRSIHTAPPAMMASASTSTSTPSLSLHSRPLRLAIIGAGPAGFYAAARLFGLPGADKLRIDMYEELPVPFGLVRYGVAPDHPEVKVRASAVPDALTRSIALPDQLVAAFFFRPPSARTCHHRRTAYTSSKKSLQTHASSSLATCR